LLHHIKAQIAVDLYAVSSTVRAPLSFLKTSKTVGGATKIIPGFNLRSFLLAVALLAGTACATHASAQQQAFLVDLNSGTATSLGMLDGNYGIVSGINDSGQVVGSVENRAFITDPNGVGMRDLGGGSAKASGINDAGQVTGYFSTTGGHHHAFVTACWMGSDRGQRHQ
jgi:uncharacterized membrane protein